MFVIVGSLLLGAAQPALAEADLQCVLGRLGEVDAARLVAELEQDRGEPSDAAAQPLERATESCSKERGWSEAQATTMVSASVLALMGGAAETRLADAGFSAGPVDAWFKAQSDDVRARMSEADSRRLFEALAAGGTSKEVLAAQAPSIARYVAALMGLERIARGLPLE